MPKEGHRHTEESQKIYGDSFINYLSAIAEYPLLKYPEEIELSKQIQAGAAAAERLDMASQNIGEQLSHSTRRTLLHEQRTGDDAVQRLFHSNLRLVVYLAKPFVTKQYYLEDAVQAGNIGLWKASHTYDWRRNTRFNTHATWWIRDAIHKDRDKNGWQTRIPHHLVRRLLQAHASGDVSYLTDDERQLRNIAMPLLYEMELNGTDDKALIDILHSDDDFAETVTERERVHRLVGRILEALSPHDRDFLTRRFLSDSEVVPLRVIATERGKSQTWAERQSTRILGLLRKDPAVHEMLEADGDIDK